MRKSHSRIRRYTVRKSSTKPIFAARSRIPIAPITRSPRDCAASRPSCSSMSNTALSSTARLMAARSPACSRSKESVVCGACSTSQVGRRQNKCAHDHRCLWMAQFREDFRWDDDPFEQGGQHSCMVNAYQNVEGRTIRHHERRHHYSPKRWSSVTRSSCKSLRE